MRPLTAVLAVCLIAFASSAEKTNENTLEPITFTEDTASDPQERKERCTTCSGNLNLDVKSPNAIFAQLNAPPGATVHTQQSFESCSSDKGCAGLKVKDGHVVERFGDVEAFKAAATSDNANEFTFHANDNLAGVFQGGLPGQGPFWWMNENSPFKNQGSGNFKEFSKSSSSYTSGTNGAGGVNFGANIDLSGNPFLNGDFAKLGGELAGIGASAVKPNFQTSFSESSSYSTSNKGGSGVDISKNPFLNGNYNRGNAGAGFQGGFNGNSGANTNSFAAKNQFSSSNKFTGYTGSSPSPFTASTSGSNNNLIQGGQKASEFDFEQQNIDEAFQGTGNVVAHEHSGGELQQTCAGQGYVCVHKAQCNNGVVNTNGANILQAKTKKQYCNIKTEICCRIEVSSLQGAGGLQGSLGVGSATFSGGNQGSGGRLFVSSNQGGSGSANSGSASSGSANSGSAFGQAGQSGQSGQAGFESTSFGASGSSFGASASGTSGSASRGQSGQSGQSGFGVQASFGSTGAGSTATGTTGSGSNFNAFGQGGSVNRGESFAGTATATNRESFGSGTTNTNRETFGSGSTNNNREFGSGSTTNTNREFGSGSTTNTNREFGSGSTTNTNREFGSGSTTNREFSGSGSTNRESFGGTSSNRESFGGTSSNRESFGSGTTNRESFGGGVTFGIGATGTNRDSFGQGSTSTNTGEFSASGSTNRETFGQSGTNTNNRDFGQGIPNRADTFGQGTSNREFTQTSSTNRETFGQGSVNRETFGQTDVNRDTFGQGGTGSVNREETVRTSTTLRTRGGTFGNAPGNGNAPGFGTTGDSKFGATGSGSSFSFGASAGSASSSGPVNRFNTNQGGNEVNYKQTSQTNFIETDSFSAGSDNNGFYRPGQSGLKPGVPYLPPIDATISGTNVVTSTYGTSPRPVTQKPTYLPPVSSTTAPGYLPPDDERREGSVNTETRVPKPNYDEGSIILDETRPPRPKPVPNQPNEIPSGCAAALKCTPIEYCTAEGVISNTTVVLTRDQDAYRVPLTDCKDLSTGRTGKCCRDPYYTDPWPVNQLGKWVQGVFGGNDGKYTPDSRGSGSQPRPVQQVTARPPVTGSTILNNFRAPKPTVPAFGPNQVTPGFPAPSVTVSSTSQGFGQKGQFGVQSQGQYSQGGRGQYSQGGQGQFSQGGQGQLNVGGQAGQGSQQNQGSSYTQTSQSSFGTSTSQGQFGQGGKGQFGQGEKGQFAQGGKGQFSQGSQGTYTQGGKGQFVSQGQGQVVSQGQGSFGQSGKGQFVSQGQGQSVSQGQGAFGQGGKGQFVSQGQGQFGQAGVGQFGQGAQGQYTQTTSSRKEFGQTISQGQGQGSFGGQGQAVITGQGQSVSQGFGQGVRQGSGFTVSQSGGFGAENDFSESSLRVTLSQYTAGGQCGYFNGQKPYGNRNDLEVDFAEIPWQAMVLLQTNRSLLCGGVITRPDVVVTSAACVEGLQAKNVLIKGGEWKLGIDDEPLPFQIVQVKNILRHPFYKRGSYNYDAAILVLSENLRFAKNIYPICLPRAGETLDAFYNGAGECIVTGWGKQVLQAHLQGSILHSVNVSLLNPGECQSKLSSDYPHLLEQYDQDSCACGVPTNPVNNICKVDIGSALACTTDNQHWVFRGVYSWDSGCQLGNQLAAFYKFDLEWYEWAIGLIESARFAQFTSGQTNSFAGQINSAIKGQGVKGGVKGFAKGQQGFGFTQSQASFGSQGSGQFGSQGSGQFGSQGSGQFGSQGSGQFGSVGQGQLVSQGKGQFGSQGSGQFGSQGSGQFGSQGSGQFGSQGTGQFGQQGSGFGQNQYSQSSYQFGSDNSQGFGQKPISNSFSASYSEKKVFQSEPQIVSYTTKPEIVTFTTKPEYFTYTTKPEIVTFTTKPEYFTYTTKPKIVSYTTKPQIITYETSGSGTNPQYVAPGVAFNPSFADVVGAHSHNAQCKCEGKK